MSGEYGADYGMPVGNSVREKLKKLKLPESFPRQGLRCHVKFLHQGCHLVEDILT